jgi:hypothetical protein
MPLTFRTLCVLVVFVLLVVGLGACDAATKSNLSSTTAANTRTTSSLKIPTTPLPGNGHGSLSPDAVARHSKKGQAGFRAPRSDNSIPNFGREADPFEQKPAVTALRAFLQASAKGEWSRVCSYLTGPTRRQLEMFTKSSTSRKINDCGSVLTTLMSHAGETNTKDLSVDMAVLRVKGNAAFALLHGPDAAKYVMPMQREAGAWKMSQLTPVAYPLGASSAAAP